MKRLFLATILIYVCGTQLSASTLNVPGGPYGDIQTAINDARDGDTVIVAPGIYFENINFLGKAIILRSADPNDPNVVASTVIDGSKSTDPNRGSVATFSSGEGAGSVLEGFTITGGTGSWLAISWEFKGLRWNRCGGGVVCYNMSAPTVRNNVFVNNSAGQGGGYYVYGDPVSPSDPGDPDIHLSPLIADNTFINNTAVVEHGFAPPNDDYHANDHGDGGAIVAFQGCDAVITRNTMLNNHADMYGGAIHVRQWSNGLIEGNRIEGNDSALGAGIHVTYLSDPIIRQNLIKANIAGSLGGGGIYAYYKSSPLIERNVITENHSANGAGLGIHWSSESIIRGNLIYGNHPGTVLLITSSAPTITHNTIAANDYTGIHYRPGSSGTLANNIIASNGGGYGVNVIPDASPVIRHNNVWGNQAGEYGPEIADQTGMNGNISFDPEFIDPNTDDFHLNYSSRCINAADANMSYESLEDYDGQPRKLGQFADMGADEAWPVWNVAVRTGYPSIQQAIDDANNGDVLAVTIGTHSGPGNRDIDFKGKAVTVRSIDPDDSTVVSGTVIDCRGSEGQGHRGFIFENGEGTDSVLDGLKIINGAGTDQGGAIDCVAGSPTMRNCILTENSANGNGGAINCRGNSNPVIIRCVITSNACGPSGSGGGICCYQSSPVISNCIITDNSARDLLQNGGGISCHEGAEPIVTNCFVAGNTAGLRGGGIYSSWSGPLVTNCTIIGNAAREGGGVAVFGGDRTPEKAANPVLTNCILRNNKSTLGTEGALINDAAARGSTENCEMTISHCNVQNGLGGIFVDLECILHWGPGNIEDDPCFADAGYWDDSGAPAEPNGDFFAVGGFNLLPVSVCIDNGDNNSAPVLTDTDLDGEERIFGDAIDIGADEVVTNPIDLNIDGIVDYLELIVLASEWLDAGELETDFQEDGFIDFSDYARFGEQWLWKGAWRR